MIRRVSVKNYKSIAACTIELGNLTFLVGPNGAGKSNFLDSLRFVTDALNSTVEQALRDRGGIQWVRRRSRGHPTHFGIGLEFSLLDGRNGRYAFKIGAEREGSFVVQHEECRITPFLDRPGASFTIEEGRVVEQSCEIPAAFERDRLALVAVSGLPEFRPAFDALRGMAFYSLNPDRIRDLQDPDPGQVLARDGRNLAAVVRELGRGDGGRALVEVCEHLQKVVPGVVGVRHRPLGPKETLEFQQRVAGDENPWNFYAASMSDGTVRALGVLVSVFQAGVNGTRRVSLVGLEEPEIALHPGALGVIASALVAASARTQVIVTTQSADLLDSKEIGNENLLVVSADEGNTIVSGIDEYGRAALKERLYTTGELLRMKQLEPDRTRAEGMAAQSIFPFLKD